MHKLTAFSCVLGCVSVLALPAQGADLLEIYRQALAYDPVYRAARAARDAGLEKLPQGRALLLPSLTASANTVYNDVENTYHASGPFPSGNARYNSHGYNVVLTQPIYRRQNFAQFEQAKAAVAATEAEFAHARQLLALRVAQAYFDVLLARDNLELARAQKTAIAEQLAQAKRAFEVGTATITDAHEAQARYDLVSAQEIAATNDLEVKTRALERLTGKPVDSIAVLGADPPLEEPKEPMEAWVEKALAANPVVAAKRAALDAASRQVDVARAAHHPTLDAVATYSDNRTGGGTFGAFDQTAKTLGLQLSIPLYQGGGTASRVREALALEEKAREELEATVREVSQEVREAYLAMHSGLSRVRALKQAVASSMTSLESTELGLEVGVRTAVDVLNARQQVYAARRDLAQATYGLILAQLKLEAAAGQLDAADIERVNAWLAQTQPLSAK